jgi:hypothetical protein
MNISLCRAIGKVRKTTLCQLIWLGAQWREPPASGLTGCFAPVYSPAFRHQKTERKEPPPRLLRQQLVPKRAKHCPIAAAAKVNRLKGDFANVVADKVLGTDQQINKC